MRDIVEDWLRTRFYGDFSLGQPNVNVGLRPGSSSLKKSVDEALLHRHRQRQQFGRHRRGPRPISSGEGLVQDRRFKPGVLVTTISDGRADDEPAYLIPMSHQNPLQRQ